MKKNFRDAVAEVLLSVGGSIGAVFLISALLAANDTDLRAAWAFSGYFSGGQVGLTVLAVSGAAFGALLRHPQKDKLGSVLLGILLLCPIIATAVIIGMNPGFIAGGLTDTLLKTLWGLYVLIHALWFVFILISPNLPNAQEAGEAEHGRVSNIKPGAQRRE